MDIYLTAVSIVKRLQKRGHQAYFAGGWVRDYLMGRPSEDIDIATSALPNEVAEIFLKTLHIGAAFGVVIVIEERHQFEVSTFRVDLEYLDGRRPARIEHSTPKEDALRRDFTINGLFYDPIEEKVLDYVGGKEDIERQVIRTIGDPYERFKEDRLRMVRAARFTARFDFTLDSSAEQAICDKCDTLFPAVAMERVWQELQKMAAHPRFDKALLLLYRLRLLPVIFPDLAETSLEAIEMRVSSFADFPKNCPPILYLMELFPTKSIKEKEQICRLLKVSNRDLSIVAFVHKGLEMLVRDVLKHEWVHFYANSLSEICLLIAAARMPKERQELYLQQHYKRRKVLLPHIDREVHANPIVTSRDLVLEGVKPGRSMGELLRYAEEIAIDEDLHTKDEILPRLQKSPLWPR